MPQATAAPDQIIAHLDLLRAVEKLLREADTVRQKRDALMRSLPPTAGEPQQQTGAAR